MAFLVKKRLVNVRFVMVDEAVVTTIQLEVNEHIQEIVQIGPPANTQVFVVIVKDHAWPR